MDPTNLSISLEGFLRELGLAWQRMSLYQEGHPARQEVVLRAHAVLAALAAARGGFAVGVAPDGFVGKDRRINSGPARQMAESLYLRHVAVVRFAEETGAEDLKAFLQVLPKGRPSEDEPPLWDLLAAQGVSLVRLDPIDLTYVDAGEEAAGEASEEAEPLWDSLLRAVLDQVDGTGGGSGTGGTGGGAGAGTSGPQGRQSGGGSLRGLLEAVERLLGDRGVSFEELRVTPPADSALDRSPGRPTGAGTAAPGAEVARLGGALAGAVASRLAAGGSRTGHDVAELLAALPDALGRVVLDRAVAELVAPSAGLERASAAEDSERAAGFGALAESLPAVEVIAALRRVRAAGVSFSPSVVALVEGLISHAGRSGPANVSAAELAGELAALFSDDDPDRRLPSEAELDRLALDLVHVPVAQADPEAVSLRVETLTEQRQLVQLSLTLVDLLERPFLDRPGQEAVIRRLGGVFRSLLAEGALAPALRIPERLEEMRGVESTASAAELALAELSRPESAMALVERPETLPSSAVSTVLRLTELLGDDLLDDLLETMCEEEDLSRRRNIFDLMVSLGPPVVPRAVALLEDERWYVQRNMISLLRRVGGGLPVGALGRSLDHADPRVRLEALKGLGQGPVPADLIARAVNDPDPKVAQAAMTAIGSHRLEAGVGPLVALLAPRDPFGRNRELRILALETLGQLGDPSALEGIAHFLRPWFSTVGAGERHAAYASLSGYPPESRRRWIKQGRWSSDPVVRRICREIRRKAGEEAS